MFNSLCLLYSFFCSITVGSLIFSVCRLTTCMHLQTRKNINWYKWKKKHTPSQNESPYSQNHLFIEIPIKSPISTNTQPDKVNFSTWSTLAFQIGKFINHTSPSSNSWTKPKTKQKTIQNWHIAFESIWSSSSSVCELFVIFSCMEHGNCLIRSLSHPSVPVTPPRAQLVVRLLINMFACVCVCAGRIGRQCWTSCWSQQKLCTRRPFWNWRGQSISQ